MKIALIGQGAMGQLVGSLARAENHEIALTFSSHDSALNAREMAEQLRGLDVAIDFSVGSAAPRNVEACAQAGVPLVEGTTGWGDEQARVLKIMREQEGAMVWGANFSIGVNLFYRLVAYAGELFHATEDYAPFIEEAHHSRKRDAPSG